jgi:hypothetical protein
MAQPAFDGPTDRIKALLDDAEASATTRVRWWDHLTTWLTGADIERAWAALHEADELLYLVRSDASVRAKLPELLASVQSRFSTSDPRRTAYEKILEDKTTHDDTAIAPNGSVLPDRESLRQIRENLNQVNDDAHGRLRNFRNIALTITVLLSLGMIGIAFDPPHDPWLPINHGAKPWPTVWQVQLVGALGGLLAGVTTLRALQGFAGPYGLPTVMAALKVPAGALTGLLGALWMQNGIISGLSAQDGLKILAYVALFGYAQQALTTFADRQAGALLGQAKGTKPASASGAAP